MPKMLELAASDGFVLSAYRADPSGTPRGGLVVAQEIFGVNSHIRSVCDGFAADGYAVIAPALFDRYERGVDLGYTPADIARGRELKALAQIDAALRDVAAARDAVADAGKVGVIGYCWGGLIAWMAASRLTGFACAVPYYGGGMLEAVDEQPQCPVMAHFGERDAVIPVAGVRKLAAAHPQAQVLIYDADHGFNCDQRPSYEATAANLARERTLGFLRRHIG
ncbi:MAG: dienelactone hydrolase family protein [Betaproteobacteria bacterium]|jgi:carboxymethylenebutenolidase|nr:dienelactone hydrolase family protein [Betaproteobacteria bacterium]